MAQMAHPIVSLGRRRLMINIIGDILLANLSVFSVEKCIGLMVDTTLGSLNMVCTLGELFYNYISNGFHFRVRHAFLFVFIIYGTTKDLWKLNQHNWSAHYLTSRKYDIVSFFCFSTQV